MRSSRRPGPAPSRDRADGEYLSWRRGLSGRLHVELVDLEVATRHAMYVRLTRLGGADCRDIAVIDQPRIEAGPEGCFSTECTGFRFRYAAA